MTQAFNLAQLANNLNTSGQLDATDGLTGATPVANGGTGRSTLTANNLLAGNGTTAVNLIAPSTTGNVLTSNGSSWVSQAPSITSSSQQLAKAWAYVSGSSVNRGYNVTSSSLSGAQITVNFTSAMSTTSYAVVLGSNVPDDIYSRVWTIFARNLNSVVLTIGQDYNAGASLAIFE